MTDMRAYLNAFDDCGGPVEAGPDDDDLEFRRLMPLDTGNRIPMTTLTSARLDGLRALLAEWEALGDAWLVDENLAGNYECDICDYVTRWRTGLTFADIDHNANCLRVRTRHALAKGQQDG